MKSGYFVNNADDDDHNNEMSIPLLFPIKVVRSKTRKDYKKIFLPMWENYKHRCISVVEAYFSFRKRSLPFLTVDAIIGNQAFSHGRSNICLMYNKATNTFLNSLRKNKD